MSPLPKPAWLDLFETLRSVDDPVWLDAVSQTRQVQLPKGARVFSEGDQCEAFLFALSGSVRVYKDTGGGRQVTLYRVKAGESCAMTTSCLLTRSPYPASAETESAVSAVVMPADVFRRCSTGSEGFRHFVFTGYGRQLVNLMELTKSIAFERVEARLIRLLFEASEQQPRISLTHQEIATEIGTVREVITRELNRLKEKGVVASGRGYVDVLDRDHLSEWLLTNLDL